MKKKALLTVVIIYLFFYICNYLQPMCFGDDYLYSFIWQGHSMYDPLPEDAVRVSTFRDLFVSQQSLYFTWGGRTIGQTLTQFFLWTEKDVFNFCNALISTVLIMEIYWCANKGRVTVDFNPGRLYWIFFALWAFVFGFSTVFVWLTGACIYLWTTVFLLGFLLPYIQKYYRVNIKTGTNRFFSIWMFFYGIIAGWGNENSVCWIILVLICFLYFYREYCDKETWMYTGLAGLLIGYALLMLAPGNMARLHAGHNLGILTLQGLKSNLYIFSITVIFQLFLWYFTLKSLHYLRKAELTGKAFEKDILLVKTLCLVSLGMTGIMLFSPFFPPRSSFPGTVQLIIATAILLRMQKENNIILIPDKTRKFLFCVGCLFFILTASVTFKFDYENKLQTDAVINLARQSRMSSANELLTVRPFKEPDDIQYLLSGYHLSYSDLLEDQDNWVNVSFARYYGIKGVRMAKE